MDIIKIRFGTELGDIHSHIQRLVDEMFNIARPILTTHTAGWLPESDIYETEEEIIIAISLAGVKKEDIEVFLHDDYIYIRGMRYQPIKSENVLRCHQLELGYGEFERVFHIPVSVDKSSIEAIWSDGLLRIHMKKIKPVSRTIKLEVR